MSVTVLASIRGAPGVTTTSLLVAGWLTAGVVVEADLDGGVLAVRYGLGREPGLTTLAAARDVTPSGWQAHAQDACGVPALVGPEGARRARTLWRGAGQALVDALVAADAEVVVDAGRVTTRALDDRLFSAAAQLLLVVRSEPEQLVALAHQLDELRESSLRVGIVLVGQAPYRASDLADQLDVEVVGVVPYDRRAAADLEGRGIALRSFARSRLAASARPLAHAISRRMETPAQVAPEREEVSA